MEEGEQKTLARIRELGLIAVVRGESRGAATEVSSALIEGGVLGIEIAFTTPEAYRVMEDISNEYGERVLLGAGTVTTAEQAERAVSAGAKFLVSPGCDPELVPLMHQTGLAVLPGTPLRYHACSAPRFEGGQAVPGFFGRTVLPEEFARPFPRDEFLTDGRSVSEERGRMV